MEKAYFNWSGGKDSGLALYKALLSNKFSIDLLLTSINSEFKRVSMHGVREELLEAQAAAIGIPLQKIMLPLNPSMEQYNKILSGTVQSLKKAGYKHCFFGDINLQDLRTYREDQLKREGISASFPLWDRPTKELLEEFLSLGFKTIVVCVNGEYLDESFVGRVIDENFIRDLPNGVDPCGENGEFHTFLFDGPIFKNPVTFKLGETVTRSYEAPKKAENQEVCNATDIQFYFKDLILEEQVSK